MRVSQILIAGVSGHAFLRKGSVGQTVLQNQGPDSKGAWAKTCKEMSGLVSPYYVPEKDGTTRVVCVPGMCGENFIGRTSDIDTQTVGGNSNNAIPKCEQKDMGDSCCTDKVGDNVCAVGGQLPCFFGEVSSLEDYTQAAVDTFDESKAADVGSDCEGKVGGSGPVEDFERDAAAAMGSGVQN